MGGILPVNGIITRGKNINLPQSNEDGDAFLTFKSRALKLNSDVPDLKMPMPAPELKKAVSVQESGMPAQKTVPVYAAAILPPEKMALPVQESAAFTLQQSMPLPENIAQKEGENAVAQKKEDDEEKKKYHIPWKKIGIGVLLATAFIEFNLRRDPRRKRQIQEYAKIFSNTTGTEIRNFSMIPYREEVIVTQAANGSKKANEMLSKLHCDGKGIKKYIQINRRIENARKLYIEGRFEEYSTDTCSNRQIQKEFFKGLNRLKKQSDALYKKCIEPLLD